MVSGGGKEPGITHRVNYKETGQSGGYDAAPSNPRGSSNGCPGNEGLGSGWESRGDSDSDTDGDGLTSPALG